MATKATKNPRPRAKEKACDTAIKKTLAYSAVFKYPKSKHQLYTFLITGKRFEEDFFEKSLRRLVKKNHIKAKSGKYFLPRVRPVSWNLRDKYSKELFTEIEPAIKLLEKIPWIKMLAVTGAVAANNAQKDDDVDIFIVTEKNRVWLTRLFAFLILRAVGKYAKGSDRHKKLCCNLFVDESKLKWGEDRQSIYVAHEILNMHPLIDKDETYLRFIKANEWALKHFKHYKMDFPKSVKRGRLNKSRLIRVFERLAREFQLKYMESKKTVEVTTKHLIHFNKHDHSNNILDEYEGNLKEI